MELDHLGVFVSDVGRARAFYEKHLGVRFVEASEDARFRMATLRASGHELHLFQAKRGKTRPRLDHVSYRVAPAAFAPLLRRLRRRKIAFEGPFAFQRTRFIKFRDPDGLVWEVITDGTR